VGPADKRVTVASNIHPNTTLKQLINFIPSSYTEQIQWRDAATGKVLAHSDYFPAMSPGILVTPGYGGLMYDMLVNGHIIALQVAPKPTNSTNPTSGGG
jgi:hypothetical protein